jgi:hypothetical protein
LPIFFRPRPQSKASQLEGIVVSALASEKIDDPNQRVREAQLLLQQVPAQQTSSPIIWWRVITAFAILIALFCLSLWLGTNPQYTKLNETLLHCLELLFTATIGLLGIEAVKHG